MNLLFICHQGQNRSRTAAEMYSDKYSTDYAGLYSCLQPRMQKLIAWADVIICMEPILRRELARDYEKELFNKTLLNLEIPDIYGYGTEKLKEVIKEAMQNLEL